MGNQQSKNQNKSTNGSDLRRESDRTCAPVTPPTRQFRDKCIQVTEEECEQNDILKIVKSWDDVRRKSYESDNILDWSVAGYSLDVGNMICKRVNTTIRTLDQLKADCAELASFTISVKAVSAAHNGVFKTDAASAQ